MCLFSLLFAFFVSIYLLFVLLLLFCFMDSLFRCIFFFSCFSASSLLHMHVLCIYTVDYTVYDMRSVNWRALNTNSKDRTGKKQRKERNRERERGKFLSLLLLLLYQLVQWRRPIDKNSLLCWYIVKFEQES